MKKLGKLLFYSDQTVTFEYMENLCEGINERVFYILNNPDEFEPDGTVLSYLSSDRTKRDVYLEIFNDWVIMGVLRKGAISIWAQESDLLYRYTIMRRSHDKYYYDLEIDHIYNSLREMGYYINRFDSQWFGCFYNRSFVSNCEAWEDRRFGKKRIIENVECNERK